jgi:hypothetical protein
MEQKHIIEEEKIKFSRSATGKFSYEFRLFGKPEENLERVKMMKEELNKLCIQDDVSTRNT